MSGIVALELAQYEGTSLSDTKNSGDKPEEREGAQEPPAGVPTVDPQKTVKSEVVSPHHDSTPSQLADPADVQEATSWLKGGGVTWNPPCPEGRGRGGRSLRNSQRP